MEKGWNFLPEVILTGTLFFRPTIECSGLIPEEGTVFTVQQVVAVLKQAEIGTPVAGLIRQVGIT